METNEKRVVMAVFSSLLEMSYSELNKILGSVTIQEMQSLYHRLKWEDCCRQYGKDYEDMTEDDWQVIYEQKLADDEARSYRDCEEREE